MPSEIGVVGKVKQFEVHAGLIFAFGAGCVLNAGSNRGIERNAWARSPACGSACGLAAVGLLIRSVSGSVREFIDIMPAPKSPISSGGGGRGAKPRRLATVGGVAGCDVGGGWMLQRGQLRTLAGSDQPVYRSDGTGLQFTAGGCCPYVLPSKV